MTTTNCHWYQSKLEAFFSEELPAEDLELFKTHLVSCEDCSRQVRELNGIDPAVRQVFQHRLATARAAAQWNTRPRVWKLALAGSTVAAALILGVSLLTNPGAAPKSDIVQQQQLAPEPKLEQVVEAPKQKTSEAGDPKLAKPTEGTPVPPAPQPELDRRPVDGPEFAILDPNNGQSNTLEDYRGRALLFGVISSEEKEAIANLQALYKEFGTNPKVFVRAVPEHRDDKIEGATFPVWYNHGSKLMGVQKGQFVLLDASGASKMKGSLASAADIEKARTQLGQLTK
jgi:hypothetical protein